MRRAHPCRMRGEASMVWTAENARSASVFLSSCRTEVLDTVIAIASELGITPSQVAIAWAGTSI